MLFNSKPSEGRPVEDLANLKVHQARLSDVLSVSGAADDFSDVDFTIDRVESFEAGSNHWVEFSGSWRDRRVYLEVHREDTVRVLGNFDGRKLTLDELGLSEDDLSQIDARQNPADFFDFNGKFWLYRFSREIGVFSSANAAGRGFYAWQFQEQDAQRFISIRKFAGEPFAAAIWSGIESGDISVYRGA